MIKTLALKSVAPYVGPGAKSFPIYLTPEGRHWKGNLSILYLVMQSYTYQDGGDNNCFVFHPCCVICKDIRFGDGHFVNFIPVSNLSGRNTIISMKSTCV